MVGNVPGTSEQEEIAITGMLSVHVVKVSAVSRPVILDELNPLSTSASKDVCVQLMSPTLGICRVAGSLEVFLIVVAPDRTLPGSRRRAVEADADIAPNATNPSMATAVSDANFRINIESPSYTTLLDVANGSTFFAG
jgi:hypothetical protein